MPEKWKLVPIEPTPEMLGAVVTSMDDFLLGKDAEKQYREDWTAMLDAAPKPPNETMTAEEARSCQDWAGMDGACAFHLIERHADGWDDVARMMQAWLDANRELPNTEVCGNERR